MKEKLLILESAWNHRRNLRAEGNKLYADIKRLEEKFYNLCALKIDLFVEDYRIISDRNSLRAKFSKLYADGEIVWIEAILACCGNIKINWEYIPSKDDFKCKLETGEVFEP